MYVIKGQTYLEGKVYEDLIKKGLKCDVFLEDEDEWVSGIDKSSHYFALEH